MALKDTCKTLKTLLDEIQGDLEKAEAGNKAASQRVRTATIRLEKAAKIYRKESIKADKNGFMKKAKAAAKKKPAAAPTQKKQTKKGPSAQSASSASSKKSASSPAAKISTSKAPSAPKKRATAKLPKRKKK